MNAFFRQFKGALILFSILLTVDFASKYATHLFLPEMGDRYLWYPYGGIGIFKNFLGIECSISHMTNKGAVWGVLSSFQGYLVFFRCLLLVGLVVYLIFYNRDEHLKTPLTLVIAGAFGNIVDFFLYGHVVDMIHFVFWGYDYPVFNVADSAIFVGIAWLMIDALWRERKERRKGKNERSLPKAALNSKKMRVKR